MFVQYLDYRSVIRLHFIRNNICIVFAIYHMIILFVIITSTILSTLIAQTSHSDTFRRIDFILIAVTLQHAADRCTLL